MVSKVTYYQKAQLSITSHVIIM